MPHTDGAMPHTDGAMPHTDGTMPGETERSEVIRSRPRKLQPAPFGYRRTRSLLSAVSWYDTEVATFCYCDEKLARAPV